VNIRMQAHPADNAALRIPQGETAQLEPAVHAISTAEAALNFVRLSGFECVLPRIDRAGEIFRMKDVAAGPALQFLKCLAEIIQILLIDEFEFACGCQSVNKAGNAIYNHAKVEFARTQGFLGTLAVVNIRGNTIPADHATI